MLPNAIDQIINVLFNKPSKYIFISISLLFLVSNCSYDELELSEGNKTTKNFIINTKDSLDDLKYKKLPPDKAKKLLEKDEKELGDEILILINEYRKRRGLTILINNKTAKIEALRHSEHQAKTGHMSHQNSKGRASAIFAIENAEFYGENVAFGYLNMQELVSAWIASENHRTMIEWDFTHTGIGTVANDKGVLYFTQIFYK